MPDVFDLLVDHWKIIPSDDHIPLFSLHFEDDLSESLTNELIQSILRVTQAWKSLIRTNGFEKGVTRKLGTFVNTSSFLKVIMFNDDYNIKILRNINLETYTLWGYSLGNGFIKGNIGERQRKTFLRFQVIKIILKKNF